VDADVSDAADVSKAKPKPDGVLVSPCKADIVGLCDGAESTFVADGRVVGGSDDGALLGADVGFAVGLSVVGLFVVGRSDGAGEEILGWVVVGSTVGLLVGFEVGAAIGVSVSSGIKHSPLGPPNDRSSSATLERGSV